jgi:hypothetical protein
MVWLRLVEVERLGPVNAFAAAMVYDVARGRLVFFGGQVGGSPRGATWEWSRPAWTRVATTGPAPRTLHTMAYDSARRVTVLFGGYTTMAMADTWEWDGAAWVNRTGGPAPSARASHAMTYDSRRGRVVLFGGSNGSTNRGDTWEWNGLAWTQVSDAGPSPRADVLMAYDSVRGESLSSAMAAPPLQPSCGSGMASVGSASMRARDPPTATSPLGPSTRRAVNT